MVNTVPHRGLRTIDRQSLPSARDYLAGRGLISIGPKSLWASICCPAHKSGKEKHASLRVNLVDGHFCCMACGVKGGDVIALHRLITRAGFLEAVRDLGVRFHE